MSELEWKLSTTSQDVKELLQVGEYRLSNGDYVLYLSGEEMKQLARGHLQIITLQEYSQLRVLGARNPKPDPKIPTATLSAMFDLLQAMREIAVNPCPALNEVYDRLDRTLHCLPGGYTND